jgi:hypothetical protein
MSPHVLEERIGFKSFAEFRYLVKDRYANIEPAQKW